ncbi:hypothetical protein K1719_025957 [Acacia pycnantha]|nr:hypothetical protein K1719_025957 [Acacia pycnantha]
MELVYSARQDYRLASRGATTESIRACLLPEVMGLVKIYSLRTNSWKSIQRMPYALCARTMGVFVGGALHLVVTRKLELDSPDLIIAFDLKHENFREVPMPGEEEVGRKKKGLK